ncbi:MAG: Flp family type IVb pilin [Enterobacteriaceae bacterium]
MKLINTANHGITAAYIYTCETLRAFKRNQKAVTAVEYAIVIAGVAAVVSVIFGTKAGSPVYDMLTGTFTSIKTKIDGIVAGTK